MKKIAALSLAVLATAVMASPSFADDDDDVGRHARRDTSGWMSVEQLSARLNELGYTSIREIEADDGRYEVEARSPEGQRVELKVNPRSGDIARSKHDDDDDDDRDDDRWDD